MNLREPAKPTNTAGFVACVEAAASVQDRLAREHAADPAVIAAEERRRADIMLNYGLEPEDWHRWHGLRRQDLSPRRAATMIRRDRPWKAGG